MRVPLFLVKTRAFRGLPAGSSFFDGRFLQSLWQILELSIDGPKFGITMLFFLIRLADSLVWSFQNCN